MKQIILISANIAAPSRLARSQNDISGSVSGRVVSSQKRQLFRTGDWLHGQRPIGLELQAVIAVFQRI